MRGDGCRLAEDVFEINNAKAVDKSEKQWYYINREKYKRKNCF
jgi:hypothetical protein